jgi:uncharacterized LabA/DUF88 family protein
MPTAVFVDAGFFLKRFPKVYLTKDGADPAAVARTLHEMALGHLNQRDGADRRDLYRIFVYDCPPLSKKAQYPISEKPVDFSRSETAQFRLQFHYELKCLRKVALRLGRLQDTRNWRLKAPVLRSLLKKERTFDSLTDADFVYDVRQKGTDMKIGLDIASVAYKKQADQIVLVAGDSDFVPAAKLARREGMDFILDPMWGAIADDLHEHIDGLRSTCPRPIATPAEAPLIAAQPGIKLTGLKTDAEQDTGDFTENGEGRRLPPLAKEHYEVARSLDSERPGQVFTTAEFKRRYKERYPDWKVGGILPADYAVPTAPATKKYPKFLKRSNDDYAFTTLHWLT